MQDKLHLEMGKRIVIAQACEARDKVGMAHDLRRYGTMHQVQVYGLRVRMPGELLLRGRRHAGNPP